MLAATDVITPLWRSVVMLRIATGVFAISMIIAHHDRFARPGLGWWVVAGIAVWTALTSVAYSYDVTRRIHVVVLDLLVTLALTACSALVLSPGQLIGHTPLLTTVWACGPVAAAAVHAGRIAAVVFGAAVCLVDVWARGVVTADLVSDMVLLVGAGFVLGLAATTARRAGERLRRAVRAEAASAHRERALRSLIGEASPGGADAGQQDLAAAVQSLAGARVDIVVPESGVLLPASDVEELIAVTREALAYTARNAGSDATMMVRVQDLGEEVVLTVRVDDALVPEVHHRHAVAQSIRGRVADLGATLTLDTEPGQGTAWEVRLARTRLELRR